MEDNRYEIPSACYYGSGNLENLQILWLFRISCDKHLYPNPDLRQFLTNLQPEWETSQTLPVNMDFDDDGDVDGSDLKSFTAGPEILVWMCLVVFLEVPVGNDLKNKMKDIKILI